MDATAVARDGKRLRMGNGFAGDRPELRAFVGGGGTCQAIRRGTSEAKRECGRTSRRGRQAGSWRGPVRSGRVAPEGQAEARLRQPIDAEHAEGTTRTRSA